MTRKKPKKVNEKVLSQKKKEYKDATGMAAEKNSYDKYLNDSITNDSRRKGSVEGGVKWSRHKINIIEIMRFNSATQRQPAISRYVLRILEHDWLHFWFKYK